MMMMMMVVEVRVMMMMIFLKKLHYNHRHYNRVSLGSYSTSGAGESKGKSSFFKTSPRSSAFKQSLLDVSDVRCVDWNELYKIEVDEQNNNLNELKLLN